MATKELIAQLKFEEGERLHRYLDIYGNPSIGVGHNLKTSPCLNGVKIGDTITQSQCDILLSMDAKLTEDQVAGRWAGFRGLDQPRKDACLNMAFNLGVDGFMEFKNMRAALTAKDWQKAAAEIKSSRAHAELPHRYDRIISQILTGQYYKIPGLG